MPYFRLTKGQEKIIGMIADNKLYKEVASCYFELPDGDRKYLTGITFEAIKPYLTEVNRLGYTVVYQVNTEKWTAYQDQFFNPVKQRKTFVI